MLHNGCFLAPATAPRRNSSSATGRRRRRRSTGRSPRSGRCSPGARTASSSWSPRRGSSSGANRGGEDRGAAGAGHPPRGPAGVLANSEIPLLDRAFAAMAYDTAAPANELVGLNVEDLDLANKKAVIVGKGGKRRAHLLVLGHRPAAPAACPQAHHGAPVPGPSCPVTDPPGGRRRRLPAHRSGQAVLRAHRRAVQAAVRGVDPAQAPP